MVSSKLHLKLLIGAEKMNKSTKFVGQVESLLVGRSWASRPTLRRNHLEGLFNRAYGRGVLSKLGAYVAPSLNV